MWLWERTDWDILLIRILSPSLENSCGPIQCTQFEHLTRWVSERMRVEEREEKEREREDRTTRHEEERTSTTVEDKWKYLVTESIQHFIPWIDRHANLLLLYFFPSFIDRLFSIFLLFLLHLSPFSSHLSLNRKGENWSEVLWTIIILQGLNGPSSSFTSFSFLSLNLSFHSFFQFLVSHNTYTFYSCPVFVDTKAFIPSSLISFFLSFSFKLFFCIHSRSSRNGEGYTSLQGQNFRYLSITES